jgi:hypothetical protein
MTVACDDMNSIIQDDLDKGVATYPGKVEYITASPGRNKAMLYWYLNSDSRIDSTVIICSGDKDTIVKKKAPLTTGDYRKDSLEITNLEEGVYTFRAYTVDKDGQRSIMTETLPITVFGNLAVQVLPSRGIASTQMLTGGHLQVTWQDVLETDDDGLTPQLQFTVVKHFDYINETEKIDTVDNKTKTTSLNGLNRLSPFTVKSVYTVGYDTASTAVSTYYPSVVEKTILEGEPNNFTVLTDEAASTVKKLAYPFTAVGGWTLKDLYYFPNLEELDLTRGIPETLPTLTYERNGVTSVVGGGPWSYLASGWISEDETKIIEDLLKSRSALKIVNYRYNSYPRLDAVLQKYPNQIEWKGEAPPDDEIMIPHNLWFDYRVEDNSKGANVDYNENGDNVPDSIAEKFTKRALKNVYKVTVTAQNSTIGFSLPEGVQFVFNPHGNLKADVYLETPADTAYSWMKPKDVSKYESWNKIMLSRKNRLVNFPDTSPFNLPSNEATGCTWNVNTELGTWRDINWGLTGASGDHNRVILIQMGDNGQWILPSGQSLVYYIANLRFTK